MKDKRLINRLHKIRPNNAMSATCLRGAVRGLEQHIEHGSDMGLTLALGNLHIVLKQVKQGDCRLKPTEIDTICQAIQRFGGDNASR